MQEGNAKELIVITGANKGIGNALLDLSIKDHASEYEFVIGSRSIDRGQAAVIELKAKYPNLFSEESNLVTVLQLDLTKTESIGNFVTQLSKFGSNRVKIFFNNAGVFFEDETTEGINI